MEVIQITLSRKFIPKSWTMNPPIECPIKCAFSIPNSLIISKASFASCEKTYGFLSQSILVEYPKSRWSYLITKNSLSTNFSQNRSDQKELFAPAPEIKRQASFSFSPKVSTNNLRSDSISINCSFFSLIYNVIIYKIFYWNMRL